MTNRTPFRLLIFTLILVLMTTALLSSLVLRHDVAAQDDPIPLYGTFEERFTLDGSYDNPYAPEDVDVLVTFTAPSGRRPVVPGFFMQRYLQTCAEDCDAESLRATGDPEWRVRFAPDEVGRWQYAITASYNGGEPESVERGTFEVVESDRPGFIRVAENNRYFVFDNGDPYFPIGQNLAWSWDKGGGIFAYIEWLDKLQAAGANYARVFLDVPWFIGLEWQAPAGQYGDLGQEAAWRLDTILAEAETRGIYLQLVLIWHQSFQENSGVPVVIPSDPPRPPQTTTNFANNPYNSRLNGSLGTAGAVFNDPVSMRLLERRIRYIVARWGYSPQVFAWEIVDRLDQIDGFGAQRDITWLNELIASLREVDHVGHPVTVGLRDFNNIIQTQADIDMTQSVVFQNRPLENSGDQAALTFAAVTQALAAGERPALVNEFSLNRWFEPTNDDPTGVHVQNTLWAAVLSGAAGGAMPWWWDTYFDPQDLYRLFTPLRLFTQDIPWTTVDFEIIEPGLVARQPVEYEPLRLDNFNRTFRSPTLPDTIYRVTADGSAPPVSLTSSYLYGRQFNAENSRPQTFIISPPVDTELIIRIENVSTAADAQLVVMIDGETRTTLDLTAGTRGLTLNFPLTAGEHVVVLDNLGQDWLQLEYMEIEQYRAPLRAMALADLDEGIALVWLHHREYTWDTVLAETALSPLIYTLNLPQLPAGDYLVEFWDPLTGQVIGDEQVTVDDTQPFSVDLLPIKSQLALRIFRNGGDKMTPVATPAPTRTPAPSE